MAYTGDQLKVAKAIKRIGRRRGESKKEIVAALETGLVESNLTNLKGGDRDSAGWRQERAQFYKDPTNLKASINRFYDETSKFGDGKGITAGELAARVQRPAAEYRGRYQQRKGEAKSLLHSLGGAPASGGSGGGSSPSTSTETSSSTSDPTNGQYRKMALLQYLEDRDKPDALLNLGTALKAQPTETNTTTRITTTKGGRKASTGVSGKGSSLPSDGNFHGAKPKGPLHELFWQGAGGIDAKEGQVEPQGFVDGHTDHVHVASDPKTVVALGKLAQRYGLHVGENPKFGGVHPVHVNGSFHYKNEAIDVSGDPAKMRRYANRVAKLYRLKK